MITTGVYKYVQRMRFYWVFGAAGKMRNVRLAFENVQVHHAAVCPLGIQYYSTYSHYNSSHDFKSNIASYCTLLIGNNIFVITTLEKTKL